MWMMRTCLKVERDPRPATESNEQGATPLWHNSIQTTLRPRPFFFFYLSLENHKTCGPTDDSFDKHATRVHDDVIFMMSSCVIKMMSSYTLGMHLRSISHHSRSKLGDDSSSLYTYVALSPGSSFFAITSASWGGTWV